MVGVGDIVYTDAYGEDVGVVGSASGDFSVGVENDWELNITGASIGQGCFVYVDGEEFGGIVDDTETVTGSSIVRYSGRTWHGMLDELVICPPDGESHAAVSGDANECISRALALCAGGHQPFEASAESSDVEVMPYRFPRYCTAYQGISGMLRSAGAVLGVSFSRGVCTLSAVAGDGGDAYEETVRIRIKHSGSVNHLVCLGSGELAGRTVVHLYADRAGRVSREQSIFGHEHRCAVFDYPNAASEDELAEAGTAELEGMQGADAAELEGDLGGAHLVGHLVTAYDDERGTSVTKEVTERIATVSGGFVTVQSKLGDPPASQDGAT